MNVEFSDGHETYLSAGGGVWARYILEVATKLREIRKFSRIRIWEFTILHVISFKNPRIFKEPLLIKPPIYDYASQMPMRGGITMFKCLFNSVVFW